MTQIRKPSLLQRLTRLMSLITVEPVLFFYMLGIFLLFSVIQNLIYQKVCIHLFPAKTSTNDSVCANLYNPDHKDELDIVQESASYWIRISTVCMVVPSILVDCYMGSWSDKIGRKVTLTLPPTGAFLGNLVYIVLGKILMESSKKVFIVLPF